MLLVRLNSLHIALDSTELEQANPDPERVELTEKVRSPAHFRRDRRGRPALLSSERRARDRFALGGPSIHGNKLHSYGPELSCSIPLNERIEEAYTVAADSKITYVDYRLFVCPRGTSLFHPLMRLCAIPLRHRFCLVGIGRALRRSPQMTPARFRVASPSRRRWLEILVFPSFRAPRDVGFATRSRKGLPFRRSLRLPRIRAHSR